MRIKLYQCNTERGQITEHPLGLGYLKTNCTGADIQIVSSRNSLTDCDLIGLSATVPGLREAVSIVTESKIPVILGGQGTLWEPILQYPFKHIVIGEGEIALQKIIDGSSQQIFKEELIENLDSLRYPDMGICSTSSVPIFTSRGCPFSCNFCSSQQYWKKARFHSAEYIIEQVEYLLKKYPHMTALTIFDDLFIANKPRFYKIFHLWMSLGLQKRLKVSGFVRADVFTEEIGLMMKEMGFSGIRFGAESGSDRVLEFLNKGTSVAKNQEIIDTANKIDLPVSASFMHHLPTETDEERLMTKAFIDRNKGKLKLAGWYKFCAFPGTVYYTGDDVLKCNMNVR